MKTKKAGVTSTSSLKPFKFAAQKAKFVFKYKPFRLLPQAERLSNHRIYEHLLSMLENKRIRSIETGSEIYEPLHPITKEGLRETYNWTESQIIEAERSIFRDAAYLRGYELIQDVPLSLYRNYDAEWFFENRVAALPNFILNACVCESLENRFSRRELLNCPGFIEVLSQDEHGIVYKSIRLDIDEKITTRGFIVPQRNQQDGLIYALKIYRHSKDLRPFILRSRKFYAQEVSQ